MRILIAHNYYQQPGGEDGVYESEADLLESRGHDVTRFSIHNDRVNMMGKLAAARTTLFGGDATQELRDIVRRRQIDLVHFHNTFPLISPAAYAAVRAEGAAVVQTLHNHRVTCVNAVLSRDGKPCEKCLGKPLALPGVRHACYRDSKAASAVVAAMQTLHRARGTWRRDVDQYIAPSRSTRLRLGTNGLPLSRITVKPHFVSPDPGPAAGAGNHALFVGRLSFEKGLDVLLAAWQLLQQSIPLKIIGDGPLSPLLRNAPPHITWLGRQPATQVMHLIGDAALLISPSQCHETFGRVIAEAFSRGTPVLASNLGAAPEMITPDETGHLFTTPRDLAARVDRLFSTPGALRRMRPAARHAFEANYHADANYPQLLAIYETALNRRHRTAPIPGHHQLG